MSYICIVAIVTISVIFLRIGGKHKNGFHLLWMENPTSKWHHLSYLKTCKFTKLLVKTFIEKKKAFGLYPKLQ